MFVTWAKAGIAATRCAGLGLSFLPAACRAGAGTGTGTTGVVATGVDAGVGLGVRRLADAAAEELSVDDTASSLLTTRTSAGADNATGTGEENGVEAIDNAGTGTRAASSVGAGNPKEGAIAKGFADPVTAPEIPPILGEAEDCDNRKKGAAATKLLPALLDGTEEPKPVSPKVLFDPKIEGF